MVLAQRKKSPRSSCSLSTAVGVAHGPPADPLAVVAGLLELLEVHRVVDVGDERPCRTGWKLGRPAMTHPWNTKMSHQSTRSSTSAWRTTSTEKPGSVSSATGEADQAHLVVERPAPRPTRQARMAGPAIFAVMLSAVATTTRQPAGEPPSPDARDRSRVVGRSRPQQVAFRRVSDQWAGALAGAARRAPRRRAGGGRPGGRAARLELGQRAR